MGLSFGFVFGFGFGFGPIDDASLEAMVALRL